MAVTLSVPEILKDVLEAFKLETPELFGPAGFAQDFSSKTGVLGDKLTAKISHVPVTGAYDHANGGFKNAAQDVTSLMEDMPVTLDRLQCVTVGIPWLTGLASKVPLYKEAVANLGFSLGKLVVDAVLAAAVQGVSNALPLNPTVTTLDTWDETIRAQANAQKMASQTRWAFINTAMASALGADDRVKSELYFGQKNGEQGYRVWKNMAGFAWIKEYPDVANAGNNVSGICGDHRLAAVSVRKIHDMSALPKALGIPIVMDFIPIKDSQSGLELTGISWEEQGTGDVFLSVAILFGVGVGNQGGPAGSITDDAGLIITHP